MAVISTRGLTKRYGTAAAVTDLDLDVHEGEVFGLLGPNGAGKTTTILMLLGLTEPTAGTIEVLGLDPRHQALEVKSRVGYVPDSVGFYDDLTGRQNLRYTARLNRIPRSEAEDRIESLLDQVGLADDADRKVGGYSRGMQQRLGLAGALVNQPRILILDEPTVNIDPEGVTEMLAMVRSLTEDGVAVLLSSHLLHQVQAVCDRIGIFVAGRLAAVGTLDDLGRQFEGEHRIEVACTLDQARMRTALAGLPGISEITVDRSLTVVTADHDARSEIATAVHAAGGGLLHLRLAGAELDAIYNRYFHGGGELSEPVATGEPTP